MMPQLFYDDGTPSRTVVDDEAVFEIILSGRVTIVADGDQVRVELTETQLRSLAYHAGQAVAALDDVK